MNGSKIINVSEPRKVVKNRGMARTTFARTVITTICEVKYVDENNDVKTATIELLGEYDLDRAQNAAKKKMGNKRLLVEKVSYKSFYGTMSIEKFVENCEKSKFKEWE